VDEVETETQDKILEPDDIDLKIYIADDSKSSPKTTVSVQDKNS
jgi:hypothetical protein